jgi:hypothetical protein
MPPASIIRKEATIEVLAKTATGGRIRINTASFDRDGDRVFPAGAQVDDYMLNPVVQWGHNYKDPWATIGRTISMEISNDAIDVEFEFRPAANEHDPQNIILLLWEGGWVRTSSVGFKPLTYKANASGFDFLTWGLLEWSLVPIPSNQDALRLAVKGLDALIDMQDLPGQAAEDVTPDGTKELSLDRWVDAVSNALYSALWEGHGYDGVRRHIVAIYPTYAIVCIGLTFYRVDYELAEGLVVVPDQAAWVEVEQEWAELSTTLTTLERSWTQKAGARHSKSDVERIQSMHDMACELGAACAKEMDNEDMPDDEAMDEEKSKGVVHDGEGDPTDQTALTGLKTAIGDLRSALMRKEQ